MCRAVSQAPRVCCIIYYTTLPYKVNASFIVICNEVLETEEQSPSVTQVRSERVSI